MPTKMSKFLIMKNGGSLAQSADMAIQRGVAGRAGAMCAIYLSMIQKKKVYENKVAGSGLFDSPCASIVGRIWCDVSSRAFLAGKSALLRKAKCILFYSRVLRVV